MRLYQLPEAFAQIEAMTVDGELPPEAFDKLAALESALESKIDGCCRVVRHFEAQSKALKEEAERLEKHATTAASNAKRLKEYMKVAMEAIGQEKIETELFKVRIQKSPPSCDVAEGTLLPAEFERVVPATVEPDKEAIIEAWKENKPLPEGVVVKQGTSLRIA